MNDFQLPEPIEFEWDQYNRTKVRLRHNTAPREAEQPFFNDHLIIFDEEHSTEERRYQILGITDKGRMLFVVFTIRGRKIRIISARSASKKERTEYGKKA